jgi:2-keto-4-pentenoate hydratase/2-oxohepta-3-ene-1,7-dioic acid hydratase in catechol pathway
MNQASQIPLPSHWPILYGLKDNDGQPLPAGTIYCIGRNFADHAKEMNAAIPSEPMVFIKPMGTLSIGDGSLRLPAESQDVHHEVEWVLAIGKGGKHISLEQAWDHVAGWAVGIDFTARDLQAKAKQAGKPWTLAKGFDGFAPLSPFSAKPPALSVEDMADYRLQFQVNGGTRQSEKLSQMLFSASELIQYLSSVFTLQPGDLIFTGTPSGVSQMVSGDRCLAELKDPEGSTTHRLEIVIE